MSHQLSEQFKVYDQENPQIWEAFERFALDLVVAGRKRAGAKLILERIRWETAVRAIEAGGPAPLKINNNFAAYYARKLMAKSPHAFGGFFHTRDRGVYNNG